MKKLLFVGLMLLCSTLLLSAKNISVTVSPENAIVTEKGKVVQPVSPGVYSLSIGLFEAVYAVQADGYDPQHFVLNLKSPSTMRVDLKPNRKQVSFAAE
ncbi:MAG: hypothetical protein IKY54_02965, partial [Muribaculaceae bacterium]|nr:hypothetical protein [Muribaculaceae bacterium]